jgi:hypothetical protein
LSYYRKNSEGDARPLPEYTAGGAVANGHIFTIELVIEATEALLCWLLESTHRTTFFDAVFDGAT